MKTEPLNADQEAAVLAIRELAAGEGIAADLIDEAFMAEMARWRWVRWRMARESRFLPGQHIIGKWHLCTPEWDLPDPRDATGCGAAIPADRGAFFMPLAKFQDWFRTCGRCRVIFKAHFKRRLQYLRAAEMIR